MPATKLKNFLDSRKIRYECIPHSTAYTAQGIAALTHISGKELAKTVMVKLNGVLSMAVLPASQQVDLDLLKQVTSAKTAELASEREFRDRFPDCQTGAMPPFGNLYGLDVYVDEQLTKDVDIAFNAGTHNELIRLAYSDFAALVYPTVARFAAKWAAKAA